MADENVKPADEVSKPAEPKDVREGAESDLTSEHAHGVDETGHKAPDQVDQALINQEKMEDPSKRDDRWATSTAPISVIPPEDAEHVKKLNEDYEQSKQEALEQDGRHNPKMGGAPAEQPTEEKK